MEAERGRGPRQGGVAGGAGVTGDMARVSGTWGSTQRHGAVRVNGVIVLLAGGWVGCGVGVREGVGGGGKGGGGVGRRLP